MRQDRVWNSVQLNPVSGCAASQYQPPEKWAWAFTLALSPTES